MPPYDRFTADKSVRIVKLKDFFKENPSIFFHAVVSAGNIKTMLCLYIVTTDR